MDHVMQPHSSGPLAIGSQIDSITFNTFDMSVMPRLGSPQKEKRQQGYSLDRAEGQQKDCSSMSLDIW